MTKIMSMLLRLIFSGMLIVGTVGVVRGQVDSAMSVAASLPQDTVHLYRLMQSCELTKDSPEELLLLDSLLITASTLKHIHYQAYAHRNKVRYYFNSNNLDGIERAFKPAFAFLQKHKLYSYLFDTESMLITTYTNNGEYEYALLRGNEMYRKSGLLDANDGKIAACYVLAYASYVSGRNEDAIRWNKQGIDLLEGQQDRQMNRMEFYFMLSECYHALKKKDSALLYVDSVRQQLIDYKEIHPEKPANYFSYYWLWLYCRYADFSLRQNDLAQAKVYLDKAATYVKINTYNIYVDVLCYTWSEYYLAMGDYDKALEYVDKGFRYQEERSQGEDPVVYKSKAMIYYKKGEYSLAADTLLYSIVVSDSINEARFVDQSRQLRSIYKMDRLETVGKEQAFIVKAQLIFVVLLLAAIFMLGFYLYRFMRMRRQFAMAAEDAKEAHTNTSHFLDNMSREVKIFLQDVSGLSDSLISETDPIKRQEFAKTLNTRNEQAQRVIFDILDVSKIESDRMQFNYVEVNLDGLVCEMRSAIYQYLPEHVRVDLLPGVVTSMVTDPLRLSQVLFHITRYAVVHVRDGAVSLRYELQEKSIRFFIYGENWSMTEQECKSIFDRLEQTTGKLEEMTLEMVISKGLILKMGGQLFVYPNPVSGTRFEFTLPIHPNVTE